MWPSLGPALALSFVSSLHEASSFLCSWSISVSLFRGQYVQSPAPQPSCQALE